MKALGKYISRHLLSFIIFLIALIFVDILAFGLVFYSNITEHYNELSPEVLSEKIVVSSTLIGTTDEIATQLRNNDIWAMFLNQQGKCEWAVNVPSEIPTSYTIQDIAVFSKGYLNDYPVFSRAADDGLLVLGYPKDSYTKILPNYYSINTVKMIPLFFLGILSLNVILLFLGYHLSKKKITTSIEPIITSIESLSKGKPVSLSIHGELSEVADSVNHVSYILNKQNETRANWISGISHDIRTPLSMIMGYAARITSDANISESVCEQAQIIQQQSIKIKELVQDLNLVSQLEYEMQPLNSIPIRLSKLLRSYVADLLNTGHTDNYSIDISISDAAEIVLFDCDARLITRAINNLVQNSIGHNPHGCSIHVCLDYSVDTFLLSVADNGIGVSVEKQKELTQKQHYMESTDERLDLRHGLGLVLVRQIVEAHHGRMEIESQPQQGYKTVLYFPVSSNNNNSPENL